MQRCLHQCFMRWVLHPVHQQEQKQRCSTLCLNVQGGAMLTLSGSNNGDVLFDELTACSWASHERPGDCKLAVT